MLKIYNFARHLFPVRDFLYILQLEEYDTKRYLKQVRRRLFRANFERTGQLKFTARIKLSLLGLFVFLIGIGVAIYCLEKMLLAVALLTLPLLIPYLIAVVNILIAPLVGWFCRRKINRAHRYFFANYQNTKIIAITGSYGKTTVKYALEACLKYNFNVAIIPDNINTTLGIAEHILTGKVTKNAEYLIVEMGAYEIGDIALSTKIFQPDISILTCLGDQHLERFGSLANLVTAKNEIFTHAKAGAQKFVTHLDLTILNENQLKTSDLQVIEVTTDASRNLTLAMACAKYLGVSEDIIADNLKGFSLPERRNKIYDLVGVTIVDNSYNISPQTALYNLKEAHHLAKTQNKNLVVMTAGIPEQGVESDKVNQKLGEELNQYAERVILHPSVFAPFIRQTLTSPSIEVEKALLVIKNITEFVDGDTEILLQLPELNDLSYF